MIFTTTIIFVVTSTEDTEDAVATEAEKWVRLAPVSNVNFFSKTDNLSKIAIYKLYLEVEVLGHHTKFDYPYQRG